MNAMLLASFGELASEVARVLYSTRTGNSKLAILVRWLDGDNAVWLASFSELASHTVWPPCF